VSAFFDRSKSLLGVEAFDRLASASVAVVGVGGVGGWCAEALVRTGLGHIVIMDDDVVSPSNVNRQSPATALTVGRVKVEAMKERLLSINPECDVKALNERYTRGFPFEGCDVVIDAIDSVDCKAELILSVASSSSHLISSMGAAFRTDPTKVTISRFEKVEGDGLAKALRGRFKRLQRFPEKKFFAVWSTEIPSRSLAADGCKGSCMAVTAAFGMVLASRAVSLITGGGLKQS
jgi:tRNA A37 threonylcarbamoyladenosine dehydratase